MQIINLVDSVQALDKSSAICAELRRQQMAAEVLTVLALPAQSRIPSCRFLFEMTAELSDAVFVFGDSPLYPEACSVFAEQRVPYYKTKAIPLLQAGWPRGAEVIRRILQAWCERGVVSNIVQRIDPKSVLLKSHTGCVTPLTETLLNAVRQSDGRFYIYFKANTPRMSDFLAYFRDVAREPADLFLVCREEHRSDLASIGYDKSFSTGYHILYPAWKDAVNRKAHQLAAGDADSSYRVAIFTRGETPHGGPQKMPHETLRRILLDIFAGLRELKGDAVRIAIKPHPLQDIGFLNQVIAGHPHVSVTYEHPSVLAAMSDLVITTYTSAILDSLALGVPTVDYFIPNEYFLSIHTEGSPFAELGMPMADSPSSFRSCLQLVTSPNYQVPEIVNRIGHRPDLSVFATPANGHPTHQIPAAADKRAG